MPRRLRFLVAVLAYGVAGPIGHVVARSAKVPDAPLAWKLLEGPWFDNNLATLEVTDRGLRMWWATGRSRTASTSSPRLVRVAEVDVELTPRLGSRAVTPRPRLRVPRPPRDPAQRGRRAGRDRLRGRRGPGRRACRPPSWPSSSPSSSAPPSPARDDLPDGRARPRLRLGARARRPGARQARTTPTRRPARWQAMRGRQRRAAHRPLPARHRVRAASRRRRPRPPSTSPTSPTTRSRRTSPPASRCTSPAPSPSTGSAARS